MKSNDAAETRKPYRVLGRHVAPGLQEALSPEHLVKANAEGAVCGGDTAGPSPTPSMTTIRPRWRSEASIL